MATSSMAVVDAESWGDYVTVARQTGLHDCTNWHFGVAKGHFQAWALRQF